MNQRSLVVAGVAVAAVVGGALLLESNRKTAAPEMKVLGKGCGPCLWTARLVRAAVAESGAEAAVDWPTKVSAELGA